MTTQGDIDYFKNENVYNSNIQQPLNHCNDYTGIILMQVGAIISLLPPSPAKILELGCGAGWLSRWLAIGKYNVTGVDISKEAIELANHLKNKEALNNLQYINSDYETLSLNEEYDIAIFFSSLHHASDEKQAIKKAYEALKKGGILITFEPGKGHTEAEHTKNEVNRYGVTEKDMPPNYIVELGEKIGFEKAEIYPQVILLNSNFKGEKKQKGRKLSNLFGLLKNDKCSYHYEYKMNYCTDNAGIVVLTK